MKPTVLFIDDEPRILRAMQRLTKQHCTTLVADSGLEALNILSMESVDVIVCDQRMPGMTGVEVLAEARRLSPRSVRILLTGYADLEDAIGALNEGHIYRYLNKPWTNEDLIETVMEASQLATTIAPDSAAIEAAEEIIASREKTSAFMAAPPRRNIDLLTLNIGNQGAGAISDLHKAGVHVHEVTQLESAQGLLDTHPIGVIVIDTSASGALATELIPQIKQQHPDLVIIVINDQADISYLTKLINQGRIYRFLTKPVDDATLRASIQSAMAKYAHTRVSKQNGNGEDSTAKSGTPPMHFSHHGTAQNHAARKGLLDKLFGWLRR